LLPEVGFIRSIADRAVGRTGWPDARRWVSRSSIDFFRSKHPAAALCLSAAAYLVNASARNLRWVALTLAVGTFPMLVPNMGNSMREEYANFSYVIVGLISLIFLIAPGRYWSAKSYLAALVSVFFVGVVGSGSVIFYLVLYLMPVWGGAFLIFKSSKYTGRIENVFWRVGLIFIAAGFALAFREFNENFDVFTVTIYANRNPALTELSAWLVPLLVAVGIVATCFAVIRLIPRYPKPVPETIEPSDQVNPL
jgi:hypothetical protein